LRCGGTYNGREVLYVVGRRVQGCFGRLVVLGRVGRLVGRCVRGRMGRKVVGGKNPGSVLDVGSFVGRSVGCGVGVGVGSFVGLTVGIGVGCNVVLVVGGGVGELVVGLQVNSTQALPSQGLSSGKFTPSSVSIQTQPHGTSAVLHCPHVGLLPLKSVQAF